jgi:NCAIR mutase (PurE)-related protein
MNQQELLALLTEVQNGNLTAKEALSKCKTAHLDDLGYAVVDHHRAIRQGVPDRVLSLFRN